MCWSNLHVLGKEVFFPPPALLPSLLPPSFPPPSSPQPPPLCPSSSQSVFSGLFYLLLPSFIFSTSFFSFFPFLFCSFPPLPTWMVPFHIPDTVTAAGDTFYNVFTAESSKKKQAVPLHLRLFVWHKTCWKVGVFAQFEL